MNTIAVVEDNADNRLLLRAMLADRFELIEFTTGEEAVRAIPRCRPDLVLLDISLPGMDGTEVLRQLRRAGLIELPAIALTAHAMQGDKQRFLDAGFDAYFAKPIVDPDALIAQLERCLPNVSLSQGVR